MFKTTIFLKGKERTLQFSTWVIGEIESALKGDTATIKMFAHMLFFGLIHGEGLRGKYIAEEKIDFDVLDCYDWIDEQGGLQSDEVQRVQNLYIKSRTTNVPGDEEKNPKATAPKKTAKE